MKIQTINDKEGKIFLNLRQFIDYVREQTETVEPHQLADGLESLFQAHRKAMVAKTKKSAVSRNIFGDPDANNHAGDI